MRERLWQELIQVKHNHFYCVYFLARQRRILNYFNIGILAFSSSGVLGWTIWKSMPIVSCVIISAISLLRLLSPHIVPSEKQIEKLDNVTDFYYNFYNSLENLWFDFSNERLNEHQLQTKFYKLKESERPINNHVNEIVKSTYFKIKNRAEIETRNYLSQTFNV